MKERKQIAKLIGYTKSSNHHDADENSEHDYGGTEYCFYLDIDGVNYKFIANYSYGSCGSGYCSASWGSLDNDLIEIYGLPSELTIPIKDVFVNVIGYQVEMSIEDGEDSFDATVTKISSTEGETIVYSTGDGGCQYYSSGVVNVNEELFKASS
jgi:hypothetical protein